MNRDFPGKTVVPLAGPIHRRVELEATTMRIRDLSIERTDIVAYLRGISPEKQEIALVRAIEVGVTEILSRRGHRRLPP